MDLPNVISLTEAKPRQKYENGHNPVNREEYFDNLSRNDCYRQDLANVLAK